MIDYHHYRFTSHAADIVQDTDLSLHKLKHKAHLLYPNYEPFSAKDPMEIIGFLATIAKAFDGKQMSEGLA